MKFNRTKAPTSESPAAPSVEKIVFAHATRLNRRKLWAASPTSRKMNFREILTRRRLMTNRWNAHVTVKLVAEFAEYKWRLLVSLVCLRVTFRKGENLSIGPAGSKRVKRWAKTGRGGRVSWFSRNKERQEQGKSGANETWYHAIAIRVGKKLENDKWIAFWFQMESSFGGFALSWPWGVIDSTTEWKVEKTK